MSLTTIRADDRCDNGRTCPHIDRTDWQTLVVQGYVAAPGLAATLEVPAGWIAVEVPLRLLPELAADPGTDLRLTGRGTVVLCGPPVSDPDTLAELVIPPGEAAIEIPAADLPFLEVAGRAY